MKKIVQIGLIVMFGGADGSAELFAQDTTGNRRDFEYIRQSEAWLTSSNAVGLQYLPVTKISSAQAYASKSNGQFINYHQSNNSYELGALTESFFRMNPRVVFYGKVNYANFAGSNMGGSVFIRPYNNAFDIVETADTTRGVKNMESYHLTGATGVKLFGGLTLGGKIDYRAANYAKYKDLRHINKLFDLSATAGLSYSFGKWADLGANYLYRRSVEGVSFATYGTTDRQYTSLIAFGSFYGRIEMFGDNGYTESNSTHPVVDESQGAAFQLNLNPGAKWSVFNEISFQSRKGYYGKRSPSTPVYLAHEASVKAYSGAASFKNRNSRHILNVNMKQEELETFENVYRVENSPGGRTDIVYYGKNKVLNREVFTLNAVYTANLHIIDFQPTWTLQGGANFRRREQTTSLYPYFRKQNIRYSDVYLTAKRTIVCKNNEYGLLLGVLYGAGGGAAKTDGTYTAPSESQQAPKSSDFNLYREYEYLTATRFSGNIGFIYSPPLFNVGKTSIRLDYEWTKALNGYFKNQWHGTARVIMNYEL
jgi:hypothetical protein